MRRFLLPCLACVLVAACASTVDPNRTTITLNCKDQEPVTGTHIVRRDQCVVKSKQTREEEQRQAEALRDDQQRMLLPRPGSGMR
jgi:hypothetical protein